jgi:hypothetical protein
MNMNDLHRRLLRDVLEVGNDLPFVITGGYVEGLTERGWKVHVIADPELGQDCEVDILKEGFTWPPIDTPYGPVLSLNDVIGTKVRALADRGYARDLVDIHAASRLRSQGELDGLRPGPNGGTMTCETT